MRPGRTTFTATWRPRSRMISKRPMTVPGRERNLLGLALLGACCDLLEERGQRTGLDARRDTEVLVHHMNHSFG